MATRPLKKNDLVKVKPDVSGLTTDQAYALVRAVANHNGTGEVWLDDYIHGKIYWDQSDLELLNK